MRGEETQGFRVAEDGGPDCGCLDPDAGLSYEGGSCGGDGALVGMG